MNYFYIFLIGLVVSTSAVHSQSAPDHESFSKLLQNYVDESGNVNYQKFKANEQKLDKYLNILKNNPPQNSWSENEKKAYLINAYNAFTIKLILMNYPVESIKDIGGFFSSPFSHEFANIGGEVYSLDDIEKGMLLKMNDPRVHFAINCASESCPKLWNEAYVASKLDQQLDKAAQSFINSDKNKLSKSKVELSKIFKWYASDFESEGRTVIDFINTYSNLKINEDASISYLDYSWELNEQ
ncbi:DUF547 domain-containing protein [Psychroflexus aestuariivivens]|uniref:DUF547 domain-containing protein n=1 Tax=Psychroflexus aestuariivivens TaxID=1795040 RepID=UPI000FDBEB2F|nr:DUF547 domain-containing protein [Psychroflexus aestuariivivens]